MIISILTMIWNEEKRLREWIYFHKMVHDIDRFVFYLDGTTDNSKEILDSLKEEYNIEYFHTVTGNRCIPEWVGRQKRYFTEGTKYLKDKSDWISVLDVDEFIVPNENKRLKEVLPDIEVGLYIPMYFFKPPFNINKGLKDQYFYRVSENEKKRLGYTGSGKLVFKANKYNGEIVNPHYVEYKGIDFSPSIDFKIQHFRTQMNIAHAKYDVFDNSILRFMI